MVCAGTGIGRSMMNGKNTHGIIGVANAMSFRWSYQTAVARVPVHAIDGWNWCPGPGKLSIAANDQTPLLPSFPNITRAYCDPAGRRRGCAARRPRAEAVCAHARRRVAVASRHPHIVDVRVRQRRLIERRRDRRGPRIRGQCSCGTPRLVTSVTLLNVFAPLLDDAIRMRSADPFWPNSRHTTWRLPLVGLTTMIGD